MAIPKKTLSARAGADIMTFGETRDVRSLLGMRAVFSSARMQTVMKFVERIAQSMPRCLSPAKAAAEKS